MSEPVFSVEMNNGKPLVVCTIGAHRGTARILSDGEAKARERAEEQARAMYEAAQT